MSKENKNIENNQEDKTLGKKSLVLNWTYKILLLYIFLVFSSTDRSFAQNTEIINNDKNISSFYIKQLGDMTEARSNMLLVNLDNNKILMLGGVYRHSAEPYISTTNIDNTQYIQPAIMKYDKLKSAEIYEIKEQKFRKIYDMIHSEIQAVYKLKNGSILLLSNKKPCQIFNPDTELFSIIFPAIKDLPDREDNIYIIEQPNDFILISSDKMEKIIKLNTKTGQYENILDDKNSKFTKSIPLNNNQILAINLNKEILIYDININKFDKIGELPFNPTFHNMIAISNNKILIYFAKKYNNDIEYKHNDFFIELKGNKVKIIPLEYENSVFYGQERKAYKLAKNLVYFSSGEFLDINNQKFYKLKNDNSYCENMFFEPFAEKYGIINVNNNTLLKTGGIWSNNSFSNKNVCVLIYKNRR